MARLLRNRKKEVQIDHLRTKTYHLVKKTITIIQVGPEITCLQKMFKKETRNAWQRPACSPPGRNSSERKPCIDRLAVLPTIVKLVTFSVYQHAP